MDITEHGEVGSWSAECLGCVTFAKVDECGLCGECAAKLDRDLIRERDWDYSVSAFGVLHHKRETLRGHVIKHYGAALELIVGSKRSEPRRRQRRRRRERRRRTANASQ